MSDNRPRTPLDDTSTDSDSGDEAWATPYESEFDMTLSDIDEDLLEAMRNFNVDGALDPIADEEDEAGSASDDVTEYMVSTSGATPNWSQAAQAQRGGAHVYATVQRKKVSIPKPWTVIFVGRTPGVYTTREALALVKGVSNAIFKGYPTRDATENAWTSAKQADLVGSPDGAMSRNLVLQSLPLTSDVVPLPSPLSTRGVDRRFYVVYRGRFTGIFNSSLEAGLCVAGIAGNAHESCRTYRMASKKYRTARDRGEVQVLDG